MDSEVFEKLSDIADSLLYIVQEYNLQRTYIEEIACKLYEYLRYND